MTIAAPPDAATPDTSTYVYADTAIGSTAARNVIVDLRTWDPDLDYAVYATYMRCPHDLKTWVATHRNGNDKPTVTGYDGPAWVDRIPQDFDATAHDLATAIADALHFIHRLEAAFEVDPASLPIAYSGGRSIHVEIPAALFGGLAPVPCPTLTRRLRRTMQALTRDLDVPTLDWSMYTRLRLWRLEGSRHTEGRYKIPITLRELETLTPDKLRALAQRRRTLERPPIDDWEPSPLLVRLRETIEAMPEPERRAGGATGDRLGADQDAPWWDKATAIFAAAWPETGRHQAALALGGALAHANWDAVSIEDFLADVTSEAMGTEAEARGQAGEWRRIAVDSVRKADAGEELTGWPSLAGIIGGVAVDRATDLILPKATLGNDPHEDPAGEPARFRFRTYTYTELAALPPPEWLVTDIFQRDTNAAIFAKAGSLKTFAALDLALSVATGHTWQHREVHEGAALYISGEGNHGVFQRMRAWATANNTPIPDRFRLLPEAVQFLDAGDMAALRQLVAALPETPAIIVIDTISQAMAGADENAQKDMSRFVAGCDALRKETRALVLAVHHANAQGGMRGSTVLPAGFDTIIEATRNGDRLTLTCVKQKDAPEFSPLTFKAETVELDDERTSLVLKPVLIAGGTTDGTNKKDLMYSLIATIFGPTTGATDSEWRGVCAEHKISKTTYYRIRNVLLQSKEVEKRGRYYIAVGRKTETDE